MKLCYSLECEQFQFVDSTLSGQVGIVVFQALSIYFSGKDGSAAVEKLAHLLMSEEKTESIGGSVLSAHCYGCRIVGTERYCVLCCVVMSLTAAFRRLAHSGEPAACD